MAKVMNLFEAYKTSVFSKDRGYIITEFLDDSSRYAHYEIISYGNIKDLYMTSDGLLFQADGKKLFILFEPLNYNAKHVEPAYRDGAHRIPLRNNELEIYSTRRQEKVMIAKKPVMTYTSFTVMNETGLNTSYIIYAGDSSLQTILAFFEQTLWKNLNIPLSDTRKICEIMQSPLRDIMDPEDI